MKVFGSANSRRKALAEPLMSASAGGTDSASAMAVSERMNTLVGITMVTSAALLFGVVAAFVKATALPTLVMLQCRSIIEWAIGVAVAFAYLRGERPKPLPQAEATAASVVSSTASREAGTKHAAPPTPLMIKHAADDHTQLILLLVGPSHLWGWIVLRAFLYWGFLACWWLALTCMPIGDATTIVYCGPVFTATFARIFLKENIDWSFYPIVALDLVGIALITQPSFLGFPESGDDSSRSGSVYLLGALSSLFSAVIAGLLPVTTRISKDCFWTAVNHMSSALSALVFTPLAYAVWFALEPTAWEQTTRSITDLDGRWFDAETGSLGKMPCLLGATLTGFAGLALQTLGYQRTEAAKASVMTVLEIPFAYLMQYALFHDEISGLGLCGVALVMGATSLNLLRHMQRGAESKPIASDSEVQAPA